MTKGFLFLLIMGRVWSEALESREWVMPVGKHSPGYVADCCGSQLALGLAVIKAVKCCGLDRF